MSCNQACPENMRSYLNIELGYCMCRYDSLDDKCNSTCMANKPNLTIQRNSTSSAVYIITSVPGVRKSEELRDDYGIADYDHDSHHVELIRMKRSGIIGVLVTDINQSLFEATQDATPSSRLRRDVESTTQNNQSSNAYPEVVSIPNPFMCIEMGSAIVFSVEVDAVNRSLSHYPRYNKDHLFNENDRFDYGNFRLLHSLIQDTNKSFSTFTNVFTEAGVFVFYDNAEPSREVIVKVTAQGEKCNGGENELLPANANVLTQYRVAKSEVSTMFSY